MRNLRGWQLQSTDEERLSLQSLLSASCWLRVAAPLRSWRYCDEPTHGTIEPKAQCCNKDRSTCSQTWVIGLWFNCTVEADVEERLLYQAA